MRSTLLCRCSALCLIAVGLALSGCMTTYKVTKADGTSVEIWSMREFPEGINVEYTAPGGTAFKASAGAVANRELSPMEAAALEVLFARVGLTTSKENASEGTQTQ